MALSESARVDGRRRVESGCCARAADASTTQSAIPRRTLDMSCFLSESYGIHTETSGPRGDYELGALRLRSAIDSDGWRRARGGKRVDTAHAVRQHAGGGQVRGLRHDLE